MPMLLAAACSGVTRCLLLLLLWCAAAAAGVAQAQQVDMCGCYVKVQECASVLDKLAQFVTVEKSQPKTVAAQQNEGQRYTCVQIADCSITDYNPVSSKAIPSCKKPF